MIKPNNIYQIKTKIIKMEKNQKHQIETKLSKLKSDLQNSYYEKNKENSSIKKKCKCPELLKKKHKLNFDEDLPYHIKRKFTKNILLSEKNDKIILISKNEYLKNNNSQKKEDKSNNNLVQVNSKTKLKEASKSNLNGEENNEDYNVKDILNEISEITADLELFEMERRKRKIMKLIELMADKLDNNLTISDELLNLFMFDKKNI